jgi:hypothetical protein
MLVKITPEMFRNNNFVNKDGQKISVGRIHQNVGTGGIKHSFPLHKGRYENLFTLEIVIFPSGVDLGKHDFSWVNKSSYLPYAREINV